MIAVNNRVDKNNSLVYGDKDRIVQILNNIIGNAVKFTSCGEINICSRKTAEYIEISVEDTGIGIEQHDLKNIFNMYTQAEGISGRYGGNGLGLYITKKLIELHGGKIWAESKIKRGSKFLFTLPLFKGILQSVYADQQHDKSNFIYDNILYKAQEMNIYTNKNYDAEINEDVFKVKTKCKILVADDNEINREVIKNYLNIKNYEFEEASNGREAIEIIEKHNDIDMAIIDMIMPDMFGYEVCEKVRKKHSLYELPILIMTADKRLENLVKAFKFEANEYMLKPFDKYELLYRVKTMLTLKNSVENAIKLSKQVTLANEKVEKLIEYDKIRMEFFANISHEFRTPLNVISSTMQLLKSLNKNMRLEDKKIKYYFDIVNQNSFRLIRLTNNLIDTVKSDSGNLKLNLNNKDIVFVVEQLSQIVAKYAKTKGISLIFDTDVEEKTMSFDEEKIERVILNILSNAVKFNKRGGSIFVNIYDKGEFIQICVKDTGIGIPADELSFIFKRFVQVDKSITRENEGTGIGLTLAKAFVEIHGGNIQVNSQVGKGSEFIITLPERHAVCNDFAGRRVQNEKYEKKVMIEFSDIYV